MKKKTGKPRRATRRELRDADALALDEIAAAMSGTEWDADMLDFIAAVIRTTGREISDVS
jgi:hypothetical protein